jgi:hypothetical protein
LREDGDLCQEDREIAARVRVIADRGVVVITLRALVV